MLLSELYQNPRRGLSFELFPPKKVEDLDALETTVRELTRFKPDFFTCTYGAGGSSQGRTLEVIDRVKRVTGLPVASHLTCVGSTVDQLRDYLRKSRERGVELIVALRGDPPKGETSFTAVEGGLRYANELVALIRAEFPEFGIAVAGYPEVHQEAPNAETDMENLKRKVDAGGQAVITQLFYDNDDFYRFRDAAVAAGITVPIIPGLLPITNLTQAKRITSMCKSKLPDSLVQRLSENDSASWQFDIGVEHARQQTIDLLESGVDGLHLYVLNKSRAAEIMLEGLEIAAV
jgi:methylenetetrahydrofolate reductase (NADPH)